MKLVKLTFTVWLASLWSIFMYWDYKEGVDPGVQYADPVLPCVFISAMVTTIIVPFTRVAGSILMLTERSND